MPTVTVNGDPRIIAEQTTLADLITAATGRALARDGRPADGGRLGVAVAVDGAVVPRSRWHRTTLAEGRRVEIITAVQGG